VITVKKIRKAQPGTWYGCTLCGGRACCEIELSTGPTGIIPDFYFLCNHCRRDLRKKLHPKSIGLDSKKRKAIGT
jgi:hypothetical protein